MGDTRSRLASLSLSTSLLVVVAVLGGCGDNAPGTGKGGSGGHGGHAGGAVAGSGGGALGGAGGEADGGLAGMGGEADAGAAGMGGAGGMAIACYATTWTTPATDNAVLTVTDDTDHTCGDGFVYTVVIASAAPDGTDVSLYNGISLLQTVKVSGGSASFDAHLGTGATAQPLSIQYPSTTTCNVTRSVTVDCPDNPPLCKISQPEISATHPALNGVAAPAGDRASSPGSNYQVTFKVQTGAEDGQPITLAIDNQASPAAVTTLNATASGGTATFTATLTPDATYEAVATCTNKNGISAQSTKGTFPVDTTPPGLTVTSPTAGQFLVGANFQVCGQTPSADAAALPSSLGAAQSNLCVTLGSAATPSCTPVTTVNTPTCVNLDCKGAAAFNLTVTLKDAAGNPTSQTITGVTCASTLPSVQIIAPASDAPTFTDHSKHILAANAPVGVKDLDGNTAGAQANVVACTDTVGTAVLKVGHKGDATLTQLGAAVATAPAVAGDNCPTGLPNVAKFAGVTLPESVENLDGSLSAATELTVTVTSSTNAQAIGTSQPDDVWVDTTPPTISFLSPASLCGSFIQSSSTVVEDLSFTTDTRIVVLEVTNGAVTTTYDTPAYMNGVATFPSVTLVQGLNQITATASDQAGNATIAAPDPCPVTIGMAPVVTFTTPTVGAVLCPAGATATGCIPDNDTGTPGWQGSLAVNVKVGGAAVTTGDAVTFTIGGNTLGSANLDASGLAQLNSITIPEGVQTIVATTGTIASAGIGTGSVTVTVDTAPPAAPTGLNVSVLDRRKTSMQLTWTAPADGGGGNVAGYQIRYAKVPIDDSNFDNAAVATPVPYTGAPPNPGQVDGITISGLYIETSYYFAVKSLDVAGSVSSLLATPSGNVCTCATNCCATHFNQTKIPSTSGTNESFGRSVSGDGDLNGDGLSDIAVGTFSAGKAYLFLGSTTFTGTAPSVVFSGTTNGFGSSVAQIGDIDNDGLEDLAIADAMNGLAVYIFKGRRTWPGALTSAQADYVISTDASYLSSLFGFALARLGDFTGDGIDDFAIAARNYNAGVGRVVIIPGKSSGFTSVTLPDTANSIVIDGDGSLNKPFFGYKIVGLGHFYGVTRGTTMVVSAEGSATATFPGNAGHIYTFHGQSGTNGSIPIGSADEVLAGPGNAAHIGVVLTNLGPISGFPGLGVGNILDNIDIPGSAGGVYLALGTPTVGLFQSLKIGYVTQDTTNGGVLLGGGISGRDLSLSLIGDSAPDVVIGGEGGPVLTISDGAKLSSKPSPNDYGTNAEVQVPLAGWSSGEGNDSLIPDINGDGVADFCVGGTGQPGAVLVFW